MAKFFLPKSTDREAVEEALNRQFQANESEWRQKNIAWTSTLLYLQGLRRYRIPQSAPGMLGQPEETTVDWRGQRHVRIEQALVQCRTEMGRLLMLDFSPVLKPPQGLRLDKLRRNAVAQAVLSAVYQRVPKQLWIDTAQHLVMFGMCGLMLDECSYYDGNPASLYEMGIVPAWQLRPLPASPTTPNDTGGIVRDRYVPVEWLRERLGKLFKLQLTDEKADIVQAAPGDVPRLGPRVSLGFGGGYGSNAVSETSANMRDKDRAGTSPPGKTVPCVRLKETWLLEGNGRVCRFIVQAGRRVLLDKDYGSKDSKDYQEKLPRCPIAILRYLPVASFWARSYADVVIPVSKALEEEIADHLQNQRDMDRQRKMLIPTTSGLHRQQMEQYARQQMLFYDPDPTSPQVRPDVIGPANVGDTHGRTINMLSTILDKLGAQGELFYGGTPGRVDSARALSLIAETQQVPMQVISASIEQGLAHIYKCVLDNFRRLSDQIKQKKLSASSIAFDLGVMDETVLGVKVNAAGQITLDQDNPLPDADDVDVTIGATVPQLQEMRQRQLQEWQQDGTISPVEYRIQVVKEGAAVQPLNKQEYLQYARMWKRAVILFGDGRKPSPIETNDDIDNHVIGWKVFHDALCTEALDNAGDAVRRAFMDVMKYHKDQAMLPQTNLPQMDQFGGMTAPNDQMMQQAGVPQAAVQPGIPGNMPAPMPQQ